MIVELHVSIKAPKYRLTFIFPFSTVELIKVQNMHKKIPLSIPSKEDPT